MSAPSAASSVTLDQAELSAILAGLRLLQRASRVSPEIDMILTGCNEFEALTLDQIDTLCERINTADNARLAFNKRAAA